MRSVHAGEHHERLGRQAVSSWDVSDPVSWLHQVIRTQVPGTLALDIGRHLFADTL